MSPLVSFVALPPSGTHGLTVQDNLVGNLHVSAGYMCFASNVADSCMLIIPFREVTPYVSFLFSPVIMLWQACVFPVHRPTQGFVDFSCTCRMSFVCRC